MQGWQLAGLCIELVTGILGIAGLRTQSKLAVVRPGAGHNGWQHASDITPSPSSRRVEHNSWNKNKHYRDKGEKRRTRVEKEKGGLGGAWRLGEGRRKIGGGLQPPPPTGPKVSGPSNYLVRRHRRPLPHPSQNTV